MFLDFAKQRWASLLQAILLYTCRQPLNFIMVLFPFDWNLNSPPCWMKLKVWFSPFRKYLSALAHWGDTLYFFWALAPLSPWYSWSASYFYYLTIYHSHLVDLSKTRCLWFGMVDSRLLKSSNEWYVLTSSSRVERSFCLWIKLHYLYATLWNSLI